MRTSTILLLMLASSVAAAQPAARATPRPGDAILLTVVGETALSDTFTVSEALSVRLPAVGEISVAGIARTDLGTHFTKALGKYLKHPSVEARTLVRLGVIGEMTRPGFYAIPVDAVLADALMAAGGPTKDANVKAVHVDRSQRTVIGPKALTAALERNATVEQLQLQSGDIITMPRAKAMDTEAWVRILAAAVTIPLAIVTLSRMR
jgi:protein involved in polysaccharide export with SLBB domain